MPSSPTGSAGANADADSGSYAVATVYAEKDVYAERKFEYFSDAAKDVQSHDRCLCNKMHWANVLQQHMCTHN